MGKYNEKFSKLYQSSGVRSTSVHRKCADPSNFGKDFYSDRFGFLTDSLNSGSAEITEVSDDGNVPKILFKNNGDRPILLIDGEELKGCKQNRVLNLSVLAPEKRDIEIPVSCVEQGRWRHSSRNFQTSDNFEFADVKVAKMRSVSAA